MDGTIIQLAHAATDLLTPALPYLIPAAVEAGKGVVKSAASRITDTALQQAEALWKRLLPQIQDKPAALGAAQDLANMPQDTDAQAAFSLQLRKLLAEDSNLAREVANLLIDSSVHITASGERSVAANTVKDSIIVTGDQN